MPDHDLTSDMLWSRVDDEVRDVRVGDVAAAAIREEVRRDEPDVLHRLDDDVHRCAGARRRRRGAGRRVERLVSADEERRVDVLVRACRSSDRSAILPMMSGYGFGTGSTSRWRSPRCRPRPAGNAAGSTTALPTYCSRILERQTPAVTRLAGVGDETEARRRGPRSGPSGSSCPRPGCRRGRRARATARCGSASSCSTTGPPRNSNLPVVDCTQ